VNIAFNTLSAKAGAGISVFQSLLPVLAEVDQKNQYYVFTGKYQHEIIKAIPESFNKIILNNVPSNPYKRVLWEQLRYPFLLKKYKIDLLYSVGNITTIFAPCKILLFIENPNPFTKVVKKWSFKERIRNHFLFYLGWLSSKRAKRIRFCSKRSMEIIRKIYKIPEEKCFVLPHGINFDNFNVKENILNQDRYILTVSVVAPHKNLEVLIRAFGILKKKNIYNGKLYIVGDFEPYRFYYLELKDIIKTLKLDNEVVFTGKVKYQEIQTYYQHAEIFVFPSLEETFGIPLIEALYNNLPVIASDGSLYHDLFIPFNEIAEDKVTYFDPLSPEDLALKIEQLLINKEKREFTRQFVEGKYNIKKIAEELAKEFNKLGAM